MSDLKTRLVTFLRWSERYTKTDMVYLAKGGAWFGLGTGLSWTISFFTVIAFANLIPKETYGQYQYVLSIIGIFGIMTLTGMDTAISRTVARGKDGSLYDALKAKISWGLLGGLGSLLLGGYYFFYSNTLLGWAFIITGLFIPFWNAPGIYLGYAQGKKRFDISGVYDVGAQFLAAVATIVALIFSKNLIVLLVAYMASWGIGRVILFYLTIKQLPPNNEHDPETLSYGKHLTLMSLLPKISANVDTIVLWHFVGPAAIAAYVFAQSIPLRIAGFSKFVDRMAFPKMATQDMALIQKTLFRKILLSFLIFALAAVAYVIAAPYLFQLFFPKYPDVVPLTRWLALLILLQPFSILLNPLTSHAKQNMLHLYNFILPLVRTAFFLLLIPPFGVAGAVAGLVLVKVFDGGLTTFLFYKA